MNRDSVPYAIGIAYVVFAVMTYLYHFESGERTRVSAAAGVFCPVTWIIALARGAWELWFRDPEPPR